MLKLFRKLSLVVFILVLVLPLLPTPVLAIGNPASITIESIKAYSGLWVVGDMLFVVEYRVVYNVTPGIKPRDTFLLGIWNEGMVKGPDIPLNHYGHSFISLYLTPAQVAHFGYRVNDALRVRILGNPTFFANLTEGVNMRTRTLGMGHWIVGPTMVVTRGFLADWCIILARTLQTSWGVPLLTVGNKLNSRGRAVFMEAIPGLPVIAPGIFEVIVGYPALPARPGRPTFWERLVGGRGARLTAVLDNFGIWLLGDARQGIWVGAFGLAVLFFILAGRIFIATGSVPGAIAVSIPFLFVGNIIGVLPDVITFVAAFMALLAFGITFVLGRL